MNTSKLPQEPKASMGKNPDLWFIKIEAIFYMNCIVNEHEKANWAITYLNKEDVSLVIDLLTNPDPVKPYTCLKERLMAVFAVSSRKSLEEALQRRLLEAVRPSKILAHLFELNKQRCSESVIKSIFLEHLPHQIREILATARCTEFLELGRLADNIAKVVVPPYDGTVTQDRFERWQDIKAMDKMRAEINKLKREVGNLQHKLSNKHVKARLGRKRKRRSSGFSSCSYDSIENDNNNKTESQKEEKYNLIKRREN